MGTWWVYIVRCADNSLYTGITNNVERRLAEHNISNLLGARYTRNRRPVKLVYQALTDSRSSASKLEITIKQLKKKEKESMIKLSEQP